MEAELGHLCLPFSCVLLVSVNQSELALPSSSWWCWHTGKQRILCITRLRGLLFRKSSRKISFGKDAVNQAGMPWFWSSEQRLQHCILRPRAAACLLTDTKHQRPVFMGPHLPSWHFLLDCSCANSCFPTEPCINLISSVYHADTLTQLYNGSDGT